MIRLNYRPTALFHFKRLDATNKGALTLPMPTPYAVRCAFLAASDDPESVFDAVKEKELIVEPPGTIVINPCWVKILDRKRTYKREEKWDNPEAPSEYQKTMSLREYAYIPGDGRSDFGVYLNSLDGVEHLVPRVNYFGKRGSFVQYVGKDEEVEPPEFPEEEGLAFELEDFSDNATWEKVNVYNGKRHPRERFTRKVKPEITIQGVEHTLYKF